MISERTNDLDLRRLVLNPASREQGRDRLVVSKLGIEVACAYDFAFTRHEVDGETLDELCFDVRLSDFLRPIIGRLFAFYGTFWHSQVVVQARTDATGLARASAKVIPYAAPELAEVLHATVTAQAPGAQTFTLIDPRWRGQSIDLDPRRGRITVVGVLAPGHRLTGRYRLERAGR